MWHSHKLAHSIAYALIDTQKISITNGIYILMEKIHFWQATNRQETTRFQIRSLKSQGKSRIWANSGVLNRLQASSPRLVSDFSIQKPRKPSLLRRGPGVRFRWRIQLVSRLNSIRLSRFTRTRRSMKTQITTLICTKCTFRRRTCRSRVGLTQAFPGLL